MQTDFRGRAAVLDSWPGDRPHCARRRTCRRPSSDIYVVDPTYPRARQRPISAGCWRTKRQVPIDAIMDAGRVDGAGDRRPGKPWRASSSATISSPRPVVDADKRLVGVVTVDDVVEVIQEEADEDLRRLAGVGDEAHHR